MTTRTYVTAPVMATVLGVFCLGPVVAGCSRDAGAPSGGTTPGALSTPASQPASEGANVAIEFRSDPDPPTWGDNTFEVTVTQPDGSPVTDATVETVFSMPAMPAMNMPTMRSTAALAHEGAGRYRGIGQLSMGGTWNVIVTASRGAEEIGRRTFSVVAK